MNFPDIVNYLLTLKYPGSENDRMNWVCYRAGFQVIYPVVPPGVTVSYMVRPLAGSYAWLGWATRFGVDTVPGAFYGTIAQYGTTPSTGIISQRLINDPVEYFILVTEQQPTAVTMTNISPLGQRVEVIGDFIVIPTPQDLATIMDALRRIYTSSQSETLLQQQAGSLLSLIAASEQPRLPGLRPRIGEG